MLSGYQRLTPQVTGPGPGPDPEAPQCLMDIPLQAPKKAKKRIEGGSSNVFSMFEQAQIQEFKEVSVAESSSSPDIMTPDLGNDLHAQAHPDHV